MKKILRELMQENLDEEDSLDDEKVWHGSKAGNTLRTAVGEMATTSQGDLR